MTGHVFSLLDGETSVEPTLLAAATPPNGFKVIALGHRKSAGLGQFDVGANRFAGPTIYNHAPQIN